MNNKWEHIRAAAIAFFCVFGMVTCHGIDRYSHVELEKAKARKAEAQQHEAEAALHLEKLKRHSSGE